MSGLMSAPVVLSIGTFDGVHLGHQALIARSRAVAGPNGRVVVLSFDPHPLTTLRPEYAPPRLTAFALRRSLLLNAGADDVVQLEPTAELLGHSAEQFIDVLLGEYEPKAFVEGPDFHFGRGRAGTVDTLRELGQIRGFEVHELEPVRCTLVDQSVVRASSTLLRWLIRRGRIRDASLLCARPYELAGSVVKGDQRGRELGTPTANLELEADLLLPRDGIYGGLGILPGGRQFPAAISIGTKPTFGDRPRTCEAYLIGFNGELDDYGWQLRLQFIDWVRDQVTYSSVEPLIEQIRRDCATVATIADRSRPVKTHS